jgi:lipoprotein-anchoring transpeptidase ErfK/SrfK
LDVSIAKQTMVAYLGMQPVYATLVSTGKDGAGDPLTTHSTVQGQFLIHTKHVTDEMKSDEPGDTYHHREVPYVQFFKDGFAFHAAYWHDAFGTPKSHGCINLSPADARWLFDFTLPRVPEGWHGGLSLLGGTLVDVHL